MKEMFRNYCSSCGATELIDKGSHLECAYCGTTYEKPSRPAPTPAPTYSQPQAAPQITINMPASLAPAQPSYAKTSKPAREKNNHILTVIFLILFFPVGLVLMWSKKNKWPVLVKGIITAFFALSLVMGASVDVDEDLEPVDGGNTAMQSADEGDDDVDFVEIERSKDAKA